MTEQGPEGWIDQQVKVHVFNAGVPEVEDHTTVLRGIGEFGIIVDSIPAERTFFYPWTAVRLIELMEGKETSSQQASQQQQHPLDSLSPTFPKSKF